MKISMQFWCFSLGAATLLALFINGCAPPASAAAAGRAIWVWNAAVIRTSPLAESRFFDFVASPHNNDKASIHVIFFDGVSLDDLANPSTVTSIRGFLKQAHQHHLRIDFLTGDPHWALPEGQQEGLNYLSAVIAFNRSGSPGEQYDGFQYDVEPYTLPGWPAATMLQSYLSLFDRANLLIKASKTRLLLTAAIPRWFGQPQFQYIDRGIIDRTDEVDVMDYVSDPAQLVADPSDILNYASKTGKKVWIGVETGPLPDTPRSTFFDLGNGGMEAAFNTALPDLEKQPSFAGYAVHHYASYCTIKP